MEPNKNALSLLSLLRRLLGAGKNLASRRTRQLQLCETLPLGEKRFVAVIQVGEQKFLLGGASNNISLLAQLAVAAPAKPEAAKPARKRIAKKARNAAPRAIPSAPAPVALSSSWAAAMRQAESPAPRIVLSH